ncbi:MAG: GNAT family N-acetyltransferase [Gemmataceae bacterium]|nr:GNAT family N-acetyltransferase [Gemmataceae bacterium]
MRDPIPTDRLILRDIAEADADLLIELDSDPEVMRYIGPRPAADVAAYCDRTRDVYMPMQSHPWHGVRLVIDRASDQFLGWVFVRPATASASAHEFDWTDPGEIEVGYRYHRSAWGRGIATEAARPLVRIALADPATTAVVGCARVDNIGSIRVLQKLGLQQVDTRGDVCLFRYSCLT